MLSRAALLRTALKKAEGFTVTESVDEYSVIEGEPVLTKRRVTTKQMPPDTAALKLLLESGVDERPPSLEQLQKERARLLELFRGETDGTDQDEL